MAAKKPSRSKSAAPGLAELLEAKLLHNFSVQPADATDEHFYNALVLALRQKKRRA